MNESNEGTGCFLKIEYEIKPEMILNYPVHCFTSKFPQHRQYTGIWDCDSSGTRISQKVVQDLRLKAVAGLHPPTHPSAYAFQNRQNSVSYYWESTMENVERYLTNIQIPILSAQFHLITG